MMWLSLSLAAAFTSATADALNKRYFSHLGAYEMASVRLVYTLPWLALALVFIPVPRLDGLYFVSLACGLPLELLAVVLYMKAIKVSPLSLTLPFLAFTPAFMILTGRLILGETLTGNGILGIGAIVIGSYCLNLSGIRIGLLEPVRAVFREKGSLLMLAVSFIYSLTSTIGKLGIMHSSPAFFGISYFSALAVIMLLIMPLMPGAKAGRVFSNPRAGFAVGTVYAIMLFSHVSALSMVQAAYMIAIKRTSLLFGVVYGILLFREGHAPERLVGVLIMLCGVFVIGLFG